MKEWYYNEFKQTGVNFENEDEVKQYDEKYKKVRNLDLEAESISTAVGLKPDSIILEIGTGTGEIATRLSKQCKKVYACDVSETMLNYASNKAKNYGLKNIEFIHSGFLNYEIEPESCDAVITQLALHHLPDFWKSVALNRINNTLKEGGRLYLLDSILSFETLRYDESISNVIDLAKKTVGERLASEIIVNIRDEFPTYDWIIEGLIKKNGMKIISKTKYTDVMTMLICVK